MEEVAAGLLRLEEKQRTVIEDLRDNPTFIDTVLQASHAAVRTSKDEKRQALRNAVLNSATAHAPNDSKQAIFVNWVESLTHWHLRILQLLADPPRWFLDTGKAPPQYHITGSIFALTQDAYPELKGQRDFVEKLFNDLVNDGLLQKCGLFTMMSGSGPFEKRATELGNELLAFVSDPTR
jgi:hypothetical protein